MGYSRCHGHGRRRLLELRVRMGRPDPIDSQESNTLPEGCPHINPTRERGDRPCIDNGPWPASLARASD
jgi:hypothetical protein